MDKGLAVSVLDLVGMRAGEPAGSAIARSVNLAQHVEQLGYKRYWLAEHHSISGLACSATPVLIGQVAAATKTIRVGSGGVMLPNHAPLVVAEQFGTLEAIYPGRIDLGLGRAPGGDSQTMRALRRDLGQSGGDFPALLDELRAYLGPEKPASSKSDSRTGEQCADHVAGVERLQRATGGDTGVAICVRGALCS
jgi:luciferase family oxidoreductase group 1